MQQIRPHDSVLCDWMTLRHDYPMDAPGRPYESGRILKIDRYGVIEFETRQWQQIRCRSSDTSIRIKCDGRQLRVMGNIGRFQQPDNITGLNVIQCVDRWLDILPGLGLDLTGFGSRWRQDTTTEYGTYITRLDLAGNYQTDNYSALTSALSVRRINRLDPKPGKYGPVWGYDAKRAQWYKAKLYDKTAEQNGQRRPNPLETLARFEVQLGSQYLKRQKLDSVLSWKDNQMENVIFGRFAEQVFTTPPAAESWSNIPPRLRAYAILWRDGVDIRTQVSKSAFYRFRSQLLEHGIDIATPCNVVALTRQVQVVHVTPVNGLRYPVNGLRHVA